MEVGIKFNVAGEL